MFRGDIELRGGVEHVQPDLFGRATEQPGMRAEFVLPRSVVVAGLPSIDGFWSGL